MIPGDLLSAFPHRQFHTLPGLLDSWAALPNSNPNACMPMQGGSLYHFYDGLWYDPVERRTHDLPCERRTRYRLSQPNTILYKVYTNICLLVCINPNTSIQSMMSTFDFAWIGMLFDKFLLVVFNSNLMQNNCHFIYRKLLYFQDIGNCWKSTVCFNFLNSFLKMVKETVTEDNPR